MLKDCKSRRIFRVCNARSSSFAGSFFFKTSEVAISATPGTAVIGSGVPTIRAIPAFFMVELGDFGLVSLSKCRLVDEISVADAT